MNRSTLDIVIGVPAGLAMLAAAWVWPSAAYLIVGAWVLGYLVVGRWFLYREWPGGHGWIIYAIVCAVLFVGVSRYIEMRERTGCQQLAANVEEYVECLHAKGLKTLSEQATQNE